LAIDDRSRVAFGSIASGKAERPVQTSQREWAHARSYDSSEQRTDALNGWLHHYNWHLLGRVAISHLIALFDMDAGCGRSWDYAARSALAASTTAPPAPSTPGISPAASAGVRPRTRVGEGQLRPSATTR